MGLGVIDSPAFSLEGTVEEVFYKKKGVAQGCDSENSDRDSLDQAGEVTAA